MDLDERSTSPEVLLVYYSSNARCELDLILRRQDLKITAIDGRGSNAVDMVSIHEAPPLVVTDHSPRDINVSLASRLMGRLLPAALVVVAYPQPSPVELYRRGNHTGGAESLEAAIRYAMFCHAAAHSLGGQFNPMKPRE